VLFNELLAATRDAREDSEELADDDKDGNPLKLLLLTRLLSFIMPSSFDVTSLWPFTTFSMEIRLLYPPLDWSPPGLLPVANPFKNDKVVWGGRRMVEAEDVLEASCMSFKFRDQWLRIRWIRVDQITCYPWIQENVHRVLNRSSQ